MASPPVRKTAGDRIARGYRRCLTGCGLLAGLAIVALAVMTTVDVVMRNLGAGNFPWLLELSEYTIYVTTFLAAPWVLHLGAHVRVDLVVNAVPRPVAKAIEILADLSGAVISAFLIHHGLLVTMDSYQLNAVIVKHLAVSEWVLLMAIPICGSLLIVEFIARAVRTMRDSAVVA